MQESSFWVSTLLSWSWLSLSSWNLLGETIYWIFFTMCRQPLLFSNNAEASSGTHFCVVWLSNCSAPCCMFDKKCLSPLVGNHGVSSVVEVCNIYIIYASTILIITMDVAIVACHKSRQQRHLVTSSDGEVCCGAYRAEVSIQSFPFKCELWAAIQRHITGAHPWCRACNSYPIHGTWWMKQIWIQGVSRTGKYSIQCKWDIIFTYSFF